MPRKYFSLDISAAEYQSFYQGAYRYILTQTDDGQRLRFPAGELRRFVGHTGIKGRFEISFNADNKLLSLKKVS